MKFIKATPKKDRLFTILLYSCALLLPAGIYAYYKSAMDANLDRYDVMEVCGSVPAPVFSVPEGIYEQSFELEMQAPDGYTIYYTTDGSIPSLRSMRYKNSITVDPHFNPNREILSISTSTWWQPPIGQQNHSVVIRARCFREGVGYGKVENVIYSNSSIHQHQGFQVVHLLLAPDSLFSQERGIYVMGKKYFSKKTKVKYDSLPEWAVFPANYTQRGKDWKRPATFKMIDVSGKTTFEQDVRIGIAGRGSRVFSEKSLRIIPDSIMIFPFFDDLPYQEFRFLTLRNSGQGVAHTLFCDAMLQDFARKTIGKHMDTQAYIPAVVYINGNYWGIHNIREKLDEYYLAVKYGSDMNHIQVLEYTGSDYVLTYGDSSSLRSFMELIEYIRKNSLADETAYQYVCAQMDIDNFIDYVIVKTFFADSDWGDNNMKFYRIDEQSELMRENDIEAGKWKWFLYDNDEVMRLPSSFNMFDHIRTYHAKEFLAPLFSGLLENNEFKEKFLKRYEFVIRNCFTPEKMLQQIEDFEARYQPEIDRQVNRWRLPVFTQRWHWEVENLKAFTDERPAVVMEQIKAL